ncbi:phage tail protein [Paenibacillus sacheonensis]|uniref:Phage tail protein n=1 Tax=Paenibacillus sacheonensis TaxID=742054 RepID=A0A7X4YLH1_9BACL|nr:phage tail protein [Paenibacillus sacheonensis]MBM7568280.1 phage tail-like protein [Paenibacillus sacheonensis]NBC68533.1 hypothetical protein [Paenibacillus sacheonensis]
MSEPKFFSFRQPPDWRRGTGSQLATVKDGITIEREYVYRHASRHPLLYPELAPPIAEAEADGDGRWFLLDGNGVIWRTDLSSHYIERIAQTDKSQSGHSALFTATRDSVIVMLPDIATTIQAVAIENSQIRWSRADWNQEPFFGALITADGAGGFLVLANLSGRSEVYLLRYNGSGDAIGSILLPIEEGLDLSSVPRGRFEIAIGSDQQGWLLDKETNALIRLQLQENSASYARIPDEAGKLVSICGDGQGLLWGLLDAETNAGAPTLVRFHPNGEIVERGYAGNEGGDRLFFGKDALFLLDSANRCIHVVRSVSETAIWGALNRRLGIWLSDGLDSGWEETEWHKIVMGSSQEIDTQIIVRCYASDSKEVVLGREKVDLDAYIADPDILMEMKLNALSGLWSKPLADPQDALLFKLKGRYLWVYLELIGSESHAPVVHSLEVHFPRSTYLEYLPAIYQRHEPSRDFLARYLSLFQTIMDETDRRVSQVTRVFDAEGADGRSLRWLLGWLGIDGEDYWTEEQLRKLLKHAHVLYNLRGTKTAMELLISIYTGEKPIILEYEQVKPLKENPEMGEVAERLYAADPHVFNVLVKSEHADTEMKRVSLLHLIDDFKPAFATCKLVVLQPWVYMDLHSYLGMNTVLSEPTLLTLDGKSSMPHHTITIDLGQDNRMDQHTKLGLDSRLE